MAYAVVTLDPELSIAVDGGPLEVISRRGAPPLLASGSRARGPGAAPPAPRFEVRLDPGSHLFVITQADGRNRVIERRFAAGAREPLHLALERATEAPRRRATGAAGASAGQPRRPSTLSARQFGVFGLAGAGVVSLAAGTIFGLQAAGTWSDAEEACLASPPARTIAATSCRTTRAGRPTSRPRLSWSAARRSWAWRCC